MPISFVAEASPESESENWQVESFLSLKSLIELIIIAACFEPTASALAQIKESADHSKIRARCRMDVRWPQNGGT